MWYPCLVHGRSGVEVQSSFLIINQQARALGGQIVSDNIARIGGVRRAAIVEGGKCDCVARRHRFHHFHTELSAGAMHTSVLFEDQRPVDRRQIARGEIVFAADDVRILPKKHPPPLAHAWIVASLVQLFPKKDFRAGVSDDFLTSGVVTSKQTPQITVGVAVFR